MSIFTPACARSLLVTGAFLLVFGDDALGHCFLSAELRPRAEFSPGYKTVRQAGEEPAFFMEQRSRLIANDGVDKTELRKSLQDVRVWRNANQIYTTAPALFNVYLKTSFKTSTRSSLLVYLSHFRSSAKVVKPLAVETNLSFRLGEAVDLGSTDEVSPEVNFKLGYSQLLTTPSLDALSKNLEVD